MRRRLVPVLLLLVSLTLLLSGCGGGSNPQPQPSKPQPGVSRVSGAQLTKQCPKQRADGFGGGHAGCSILKQGKFLTQTQAPPAGALFPDVSSWQGKVDWQAVKNWQLSHHGWKAAAIFKMGEFVTDPTAARNAAETARLGFWRAGYWFVRPTGCQHEAGQIIAAARAFHLTVVSLDIEVPGIQGYAICLGNPVRAAGFKVVIYTAPGTWPGGSGFGSAPLWQATYGSLNVFWRPLVAWQFTDGTFFAPVSIPGIGRDDVNVDYGITNIGVAPPPPPPDPYAKYPKDIRAFHGGIRISEYDVVKSWDRDHCRVPRRGPGGPICHRLATDLVLLRDRIDTIAHQHLVHGHPDYTSHQRGLRRYGIDRRLHNK